MPNGFEAPLKGLQRACAIMSSMCWNSVSETFTTATGANPRGTVGFCSMGVGSTLIWGILSMLHPNVGRSLTSSLTIKPLNMSSTISSRIQGYQRRSSKTISTILQGRPLDVMKTFRSAGMSRFTRWLSRRSCPFSSHVRFTQARAELGLMMR